MNDKISKYKKFNLIISILMLVNYIMLALIGSGALEKIRTTFFEKYLVAATIFIPLILIILLMVNKNVNSNDIYENKDYELYLPFIQSILIILLFGIKFIIQLDRMILAELAVTTITFALLVLVVFFMMREKEVNKKRYNIASIISYLLMLVFFGLIIIFSYDYSVLL